MRYFSITNQYVAANSFATFEMFVSSVITPPGWERVPIWRGIAGSGSSFVFFTGMTIEDGKLKISVRNMGSSAASGLTVYVYVAALPSV